MENEEGVEKSSVVTSQPQVKRLHMNKWYVITAVLIIVIVFQGFLYLSLSSSYNTLNANHKSLKSENQNLRTQYNTLTSQHSALQSEHSTLQGSYDSLQTNYNSLQSSYDSLQNQHSSLQSDYNSLQTNYGSLQTQYSSLQSNYDSYVSSYGNLRNQVNNRAFGTDGKYFITAQDPTVNNLVTQITGGWSNTSDWNECWTDTKMMYDWVVNNIEYRSDGLYPVIPSTPSGSVEYRQEIWQLSNETLDLKQGDCEDMAILLASMIFCYNGGEHWTECIIISGSESAHMGVQIPVAGDELTILDPAGKYYTQTLYGDIDMKDISTEINNWLTYWKPTLGNDVRVDRVFSDYLDKSFSSTSEYTSWMSSR